MDFEEYYQKFEAEAKKLLGDELWNKAVAKSTPKEFAKELFDSDAFDDPDAVAEEFAEMVQEMDKEGAFDEGKCEDGHECKWHVEYELIDGDKEDETFDGETEAWSCFNELDARTKGGLADVLWVKEPTCPTCECGSSAASLGVGPNAARRNEEFTKDDVDAFTVDDPNYVDHALLGDDESIVIKVAKVPGTREFKLVAMLPGATSKPEKKTIKTGMLINVVDFYRELLDMPMENAITLIKEA